MRTRLHGNRNDKSKGALIFENEIPLKDVESTQDRLDDATQDVYSLSDPITTSAHHGYTYKVKQFWAETATDFSATRWRHVLWRFFIHFTAIIVVAVLTWSVTNLSMPRWTLTGACSPDGVFNLTDRGYSEYRPLQQSSAFSVNLVALDSVDFATAKGVDVAWDMAFGRGMQGFLSLTTYKVYTKALSRLMETTPVTVRTFEAITLQNDTITSLVKLLRDIYRSGGLRAGLLLSWVIISTIFLLSFQSIASAMTGYSAVLGGIIQTDTNERIPSRQFQAVQYVIHDGSRLGDSFYDGYPVVLPRDGDPNIFTFSISRIAYRNPSDPSYYMSSACGATDRWDKYINGRPLDYELSFYDPKVERDCMLMWHVSEYTSKYGFLGLNDTTSTFNNSGILKDLPSPILNITTHNGPFFSDVPRNSTPWSLVPYSYFRSDIPTDYPLTLTNEKKKLWAYQKNQFNLTGLNVRGACQNQDVFNLRYQWGFSILLLLVFVACCLVWAVGTYAVYVDAFMNSHLHLTGRDMGTKRAMLDLQAAMKKDLQTVVDEDVDRMGNLRLKGLIRNEKLSYDHLIPDPAVTRNSQTVQWWRQFSICSWLRREIYWLAALILFTILLIVSWTTRSTWFWNAEAAFLPWLGVILVLVAGHKRRSRWIYFVVCLVLFLPLDITLVLMQRR